jgi:hypothetical protein
MAINQAKSRSSRPGFLQYHELQIMVSTFVSGLLSKRFNDVLALGQFIFVSVFIVIGFIGAGLFSGWLFYLRLFWRTLAHCAYIYSYA